MILTQVAVWAEDILAAISRSEPMVILTKWSVELGPTHYLSRLTLVIANLRVLLVIYCYITYYPQNQQLETLITS